MKYLWALVLFCVALTARATEIQIDSSRLEAMINGRVDIAWRAACLLKGVNCEGIPRPIVNFTNELPSPSMQGAYNRGEGIIYIRLSYQLDRYAMVVMVHEMTHYLQFIRTGIRIPTTTQRCAHEEEAFRYDDLFARSMGLEDHPDAFTWEETVSRYGCSPEQLRR